MSSLRSRVNAELQLIKDRDGTVKQEAVVELARDPSSALHEDFEKQGLWNDKLAAERARLDYAQRVIRIYMIRPSDDAQGEPVRALVSLMDDRKQKSGLPGYRHINDVMNDDDLRENLRQTVLMEFRAFRRKYDKLQEFESVWDAMAKAEATYSRIPKQTELRDSA